MGGAAPPIDDRMPRWPDWTPGGVLRAGDWIGTFICALVSALLCNIIILLLFFIIIILLLFFVFVPWSLHFCVYTCIPQFVCAGLYTRVRVYTSSCVLVSPLLWYNTRVYCVCVCVDACVCVVFFFCRRVYTRKDASLYTRRLCSKECVWVFFFVDASLHTRRLCRSLLTL